MKKLAIKLLMRKEVNNWTRALKKALAEYEPHPSKEEEYKEFSQKLARDFRREFERVLISKL